MAAENAPSGNEETPVPGTVAKDGRREFGAKNGETPVPINRKRLRKGFRGVRRQLGGRASAAQAIVFPMRWVASPRNEETSAPVTVAKGGRGSSEAYVKNL